MSEGPHKNTTLLQLDPDEVLAVRENLEASIYIDGGPPSRRVPETLCVEIEKLIKLMELEIRKQARTPSES